MSQRADRGRCAEILELLDAWADGDLDEVEAAAVRAHVDECRSCHEELKLAETVVAELRALPEFDVPDGVLRTVRNTIGPTAANRFRMFFKGSTFRPVPVLAAVATVVLMVLVLSPWRRPSVPQYTDQEIERAAAETRLALAYVGSIAQRAELRVKERVLDEGTTARTVRGVRRSLQLIGEAGAAAADLPATPRPQVKGS
jgi:anti-sigma factor RsiW